MVAMLHDTYSFLIALTTALEKGAVDTVELILRERRSVAKNISWGFSYTALIATASLT